MRVALTILMLALGGYVTLAVLVYVVQDRLLYFPAPSVTATPAHIGLAFETIALRTEDGETLDAWWIPAENPRATLLFCHGNAGNISHRLSSIEPFHELGLNVLIFDYRGYGRSSGKPSEEGLYLDGRAAWEHLVQERGIDPLRIVVFGRSLGGAVATRLAVNHQVGGLILESSFTSVPDLAGEYYWFLPVRLLARSRFNTLGRIADVPAPVLVIHSPEDEIIPFRHGRRLYDAARPPKLFVTLEGDHNNGFLVTGARYREGLQRFLTQYVGV